MFNRHEKICLIGMWTLDPIDGTMGFLRKQQFAICLALLIDGIVQLGIIGCPNLPVDHKQPDGEKGCLFIAIRNHGAFQVSILCIIENIYVRK
jgi:3'(2'), 5'-bisphosphate nucleotidase